MPAFAPNRDLRRRDPQRSIFTNSVHSPDHYLSGRRFDGAALKNPCQKRTTSAKESHADPYGMARLRITSTIATAAFSTSSVAG